MSWDEKDWAYTWITGKRCRLNLLFRDFTSTDELDVESCHTIYEYDRNVYEFGIMDKEEMQEVARIYGIMIEYQYLGNYRYRFDYRANNCVLNSIDLRELSPFRKASLQLYNYKPGSNVSMDLNITHFENDLCTLEKFVQKSQGIVPLDESIESIEKKRVGVANELIRCLRQDILTFGNTKGHEEKFYFTFIRGEIYRLNLLFRKQFSKNEIDHSEVEAVFYINYSYNSRDEEELLLLIKQIAEIYGIYIKFGYHSYDFRHERCQLENINLDSLSPLKSINIGNLVSSLSTFDISISQ